MPSAPRIESDRLLLTWPTTTQIDAYYTAIVGTQIFDTILWDGPRGPDELHDYWRACTQADPTSSNGPLEVAIIEKASACYVGGAGLRPVNGDSAIIDIGYALAPSAHGKGYATEAVGALLNEAFAHRAAERIFAAIFVGNHASRRVVEKLGFTYEGTLRCAVRKRGVWLDEWLLAITRPGWQALR